MEDTVTTDNVEKASTDSVITETKDVSPEENTPVGGYEGVESDETSDTGKEKPVEGQEKLAGVTTASFAEERMRRAVASGENVFDISDKAKPAFFVKGDDTEVIEVDVLTHPVNGRVVSVTKSGYGIDFERDFGYFVHSVLRFEFSVPNYIQLAEYRRRCTSLDNDTEKPVIDRVRLREFFLVNHLRKWNLVDTTGKEIPVTFDQNGLLSDVSLAVAHSLVASILDVVFTVFEKDVLLI